MFEKAGTEADKTFVSLAEITLPARQPRSYFDPRSMRQLTESVRKHGILQPLLVRPKLEGGYELVAGERRYRAAQAAKLNAVPAIVREMTDEQAVEIALSENLQREDLNPLEETESILQLLSIRLNQDIEAVIRLLNQAAHPQRNAVNNVIHSQQWQALRQVFEAIGRFTPESFRTNRLPLLSLPTDILEALRQGQIAYTKARAIARVQDEQARKILLKEAIAKHLSLTRIKARVVQLQASHTTTNTSPSLQQRIDATLRLARRSSACHDPDRHKRLEELLAEIETLISESSESESDRLFNAIEE